MTERSLQDEIQRRRTLAIISHPDAGKTTLTEKLLLYGGALHLAGSVRARKNQRSATSDWMELEKERGISISSTILQFDYSDFCVNLLDTPGHKDFSEDTYRVLTAVDNAIMVIDAAKGIEERTRKLFEICRMRGIPIFTFMNKLDRPAQDPLALLDELERVLGLAACPVTWPLGSGGDFKGVYDRLTRQVHLFERTIHNAYRAPFSVSGPDDPELKAKLPPDLFETWRQEIDMLDIAGAEFDHDRILAGEVSPVFFGSAMTNFGVQLLLDYFVRYAEKPAPRKSGDRIIPTETPGFSGFVFKVQANMNPKHRDTLAFVRVCSGVFKKDMQVHDPAEPGKLLRLSYPQKLFAQDRETMEVGYPGDIVGLVAHRSFRIGDTLATDESISYHEIPRFPPEAFAYLRNAQLAKAKQYRAGLDQLLNEGVIQAFHLLDSVQNVPLLGAVGPLQFEVVQYRLTTEYGAETRLEPASYQAIRWLDADVTREQAGKLLLGSGVAAAQDVDGHCVLLFPTQWSLDFFADKNREITLHKVSPKVTPAHQLSQSMFDAAH
ncbi:MAG: peptide chain release factor 3 [Kiritimatiellae bacterium]|nr:peptide chain release factor 3 [Kiritimatiellia bacterium]